MNSLGGLFMFIVLNYFNRINITDGLLMFVLLQLLGKECCDIDIALDNMLGKEFCEKVNEYSSSTGEETRGIGVIQWYFSFSASLCLVSLIGLTI